MFKKYCEFFKNEKKLNDVEVYKCERSDINLSNIDNQLLSILNRLEIKTPKTNINQPMVYYQNQIYVNFANKNLGGGVFGTGYVQEEQLMTEFTMTFLSMLNQKNKEHVKEDNPLNYLKTNRELVKSLKQLDSTPIIIRTDQIAIQRIPKNELQNLKSITDLKDKYYYKSTENIYWICVAHQDISIKKKNYLLLYKDNWNDWFLRIFNGFNNAIKLFKLRGFGTDSDPIVLNTGNWGAGAFGHKVEDSFIIQKAAYETVCKIYSDLCIKFIYWPFDTFNHQNVLTANRKYDQWINDKSNPALTLIFLRKKHLEYIEIRIYEEGRRKEEGRRRKEGREKKGREKKGREKKGREKKGKGKK